MQIAQNTKFVMHYEFCIFFTTFVVNSRTMKHFLAVLVALCAIFTAVAQSENSIIIDQKSFRPVHTDALTGANIDPIGVDSSRRPCARIKMKIKKMNREDIDKLDVKIITNNQLTKCKTADYENGLILEMTAKPATRFYLNHPEFGQSNEVTLNLDPNKEYYMEASLNQTYSIVVNSNVTDAEVYLDNEYKGRTDSSNSLTIKEVFIGEHTLKLTYGNISHEQKIEVNSGKISFRQNVDIAASEPQFVVFTVEPQSAVVTIDGKHYTLQDGAMRVVLDGGTYNYTVTAVGYHSKSGTFTVAGEKVTKSISLTADVANVTLTAPNDADIWINGEKKGRGSWSGRLTAGAYIFEAKKEGYRTATLSKHITSAQPQQSYTLPAPTPIYGSIMVDGNPINADVTLDGKPVGQLPLKLNDILVGNHTLKLSKSGYNTYTQTVTVAEGKTATINATLTKQTTATPTTTSPTTTKGKTSAPYKVGDYYNDGAKEGVVFEVSVDGKHGKIVSMTQSASKLQWSSDKTEQKSLIGADSKTNGAYNMAKVKARPDWQSKYPAFKWCTDLGDGWYLPAIEELKKFILDDTIHDVVNRTLAAKGGKKLYNKGESGWYCSSTEHDYQFSNGEFCAWFVNVGSGNPGYYNKNDDYYVRAVSAF